MAILKNGHLRGQVGNLVNRTVGNQQIVQTKPGRKIRQTALTRAAADDFGYASAAGALLRRAFVETHQQLHDDKMHNRLIKHLQRVMRSNPDATIGSNRIEKGNLNRMVGFQFNSHCHLEDYLYIDPTVGIDATQQLAVHFPAFYRHKHLYIPKDCDHISLQVEAIAFNFDSKNSLSLGLQEIVLAAYQGDENRNPEQTLLFGIPDGNYNCIFVGLCILYTAKTGLRSYIRNSKTLHPAAIIAGFKAEQNLFT